MFWHPTCYRRMPSSLRTTRTQTAPTTRHKGTRSFPGLHAADEICLGILAGVCIRYMRVRMPVAHKGEWRSRPGAIKIIEQRGENFMGLKLKFRPRNGVKMALRSRPQAKPAAGAHQRLLSPLPLPRRAPSPDSISRHFKDYFVENLSNKKQIIDPPRCVVESERESASSMSSNFHSPL